MARYIDADKIPYFLSVGDDTPIEGIEIAYKHDIDKQPTADVVEVVRCKDCKHCWQYTAIDRMHYIECTFDPECNTPIHEMHFCSYGERSDT